MLSELQVYLFPTLVLGGLYFLFQMIAVLHIHLFELAEVPAETAPERVTADPETEETLQTLVPAPASVRPPRRF